MIARSVRGFKYSFSWDWNRPWSFKRIKKKPLWWKLLPGSGWMGQAVRTGAFFFFLRWQFPDLLILCGHRPLEPRGKNHRWGNFDPRLEQLSSTWLWRRVMRFKEWFKNLANRFFGFLWVTWEDLTTFLFVTVLQALKWRQAVISLA